MVQDNTNGHHPSSEQPKDFSMSKTKAQKSKIDVDIYLIEEEGRCSRYIYIRRERREGGCGSVRRIYIFELKP